MSDDNDPAATTPPERQTASSFPRGVPRGVLDPAWEDELRAGQAAEGEQGSVEAELAMVHLLRHVREPEALAPDELDNLWRQIEAEVAPAATPWWRKAWLWWAAPVAVTAAVLFVIVLPGDREADSTVARGDDERADERRESSAAAPAPAMQRMKEGEGGYMAEEASERAASAAPMPMAAPPADNAIGAGGLAMRSERAGGLEKSFAQLAPYGRVAIGTSVDASLDELREQLIVDARGGG